MTHRLQIVLLLALALYFCLLYVLLKRKRLALKYTLLWFLSGLLMLILAAFPRLLDGIAHLLGIYEPTNALFAFGFFCVLILLVSLTAIASKQTTQIKRLAQSVALLEQRVRELEGDAAGDTGEKP